MCDEKEDLNRKKKGNKPAQGKQGNVNSKRRKRKEKGKEAQHPDRNSTAKVTQTFENSTWVLLQQGIFRGGAF